MRGRARSAVGSPAGRPAVDAGGFVRVRPADAADGDAECTCAAEGDGRALAAARRARALAWLCDLVAGPAPSPCAVKLCGLTRESDADAAVAAGADLLGFVCDVPTSRRSVTPARLAELCAHARRVACTGVAPTVGGEACLPHPPWCVGVFVDEPVERLVGLLAGGGGPDLVQLHGHEDAAYIAGLRAGLARAGCGQVGVIQAFRVRCTQDVAQANASVADLVLLDAGAGCGETFDWSLAAHCTRAFALAGGLTPSNLAQAVRQVRPWCVDMSSGVETGGVKDSDKMVAAVRAVRAAGREE